MTFFTSDEDEIAPDARDVLSASAILSISEFRLFELAYERWFGESAGEKRIEGFYVPYMFRSVVPHWVRQYCREVLICDREGRLNPVQFGVLPREESATLFQQGLRYAFVIVLVMVTLHLIAFLVSGYSSL